MPPPNDVGYYPSGGTFYETITAAVNDVVVYGFDSIDRISFWIDRIRSAAQRSMVAPAILERHLNETMRAIYRSKVERAGILKQHPGVSRFTLAKVSPQLRAELDRRIMASASLIKLNRAAAMEQTIQRFSGWATSIPAGGSDAVDRVETKTEIRKALASLPYRERLVATDQGHKLISSINEILAVDSGAIAAIWHSHYGENGYHGRIAHKHFDGEVFVVKGNWASEKGFVKLDGAKYTDEVERPAELVNCRCYYQYLYSLRALPSSMLTQKGSDELARVRLARAA